MKLFPGVVIALMCVATGSKAVDFRSWDQKIDDPNKRFKVLTQFDSEAVLDRETQLVWERSPDATEPRNWKEAQGFCTDRVIGNRKGWRLPTLHELASLVDPTQSNPALPIGHPFGNVRSEGYWSATVFEPVPTESRFGAWGVIFRFGNALADFKTIDHFVWCVRGGQGVDAQ